MATLASNKYCFNFLGSARISRQCLIWINCAVLIVDNTCNCVMHFQEQILTSFECPFVTLFSPIWWFSKSRLS
jgi:hypothetical protein